MDLGLVVETERAERVIGAVRHGILSREDWLAVQVDHYVVAVTDFEGFLFTLHGRDLGACEDDFSAIDPSLLHSLARRHRKHCGTGSVPVYQNESWILCIHPFPFTDGCRVRTGVNIARIKCWRQFPIGQQASPFE